MAPPQTGSTAFVLVPGAHCPASYYHRVSERLRAKGYEAIEISLPSVGRPDLPPASMYDDASSIRSAAASLMDQGKDVVVAANSYGGIPATEGMKELSEAERQAAGKSGGRLANLVYIGSLIPTKGQTCLEMIAESVTVPEALAPQEDGFRDPPPPEAGVMIMNQLTPEESLEYAKQQGCQSAKSVNDKVTYDGWMHVPVTAVITENDLAVIPKKQHENVDKAIESGKGSIRKVPIKSDHIAMLSNPDKIVEILLEAAGANSG